MIYKDKQNHARRVKAFEYAGRFVGADGNPCVPSWASAAHKKGTLQYSKCAKAQLYFQSTTCMKLVQIGDFVVKYADGKIKVFDPVIFHTKFKEMPAEEDN